MFDPGRRVSRSGRTQTRRDAIVLTSRRNVQRADRIWGLPIRRDAAAVDVVLVPSPKTTTFSRTPLERFVFDSIASREMLGRARPVCSFTINFTVPQQRRSDSRRFAPYLFFMCSSGGKRAMRQSRRRNRMRSLFRWLSVSCVTVGLAAAVTALVVAQAKPANATAQCKDGSYSQAKTERGACSGHGGVGTWYGAPKEAGSAAKVTAKPAGESNAAGSAASAAAKTSPKDATKTAAAAPTGATGQCKDGTYTKAKSQRGACSGHGGVGTWMGDTAKTAPTSSEIASRPSAPTPPAPAAAPSRPAPTPPPAATANPPAPPTTSTSTKASDIQAPPAGAPENATAQCNDGTFSFAKQHRGACSGHKGVKAWFK